VAVSGALIYTYVGGTTTNATTYADASLATANANPIVADAAGRFVAYLPAGGNFKFLYKTAAGATIEEQDNILSVPGAAVNLDIEGTVGQAVTAGQVCYLSTGAEATPLTAGLWYLTDADFAPTSTTCQSIGVAVSAIAINTAGTIRLAGTATTATAVVIGSTYYVSATAGAITATAPALSRTVGVALTTSTLLLAATTAVVTPGGSNTQVQFNDSGVLGGDSGFTFIKATDAVAIAGATTVGGTLGVTGATTLSSTVATGALTVTGEATVSTTLGVTGATTLSSTVATGALTVTGAATVSTTLGVTGAITSATSVALTGTTNNLGTITSGVWNAGAVTSSGTITGVAGVFSGAFTATVPSLLFTIGDGSDVTPSGGSTATRSLYVTRNGRTDVFIRDSTNDVEAIISASATASTVVVGSSTNHALALRTNSTDWVSLSSAGLLTVSGFGTHTFSAGGTGVNALAVRNTTAGTGNYGIVTIGNNSEANTLQLAAFSSTYTTSGPYIAGAGVLDATAAAGLSVVASHASGAIRFYSGGSTLRWTMTSNKFLQGTDVIGNDFVKLQAGNSGNEWGVSGTTSKSQLIFYNANGSVGTINTSGSATAYNTSSDARLKHDLGIVTQTDVLRQTVVRDFEWLSDGSKARGVFAQEAHLVAPFAVSVGNDEMKDGHLAKPWVVDYSKFVPDLIVGWQQHDATITQLAARIAALETKDH